MTPQPDTRVDELRQQLKSLGYLDAGVDRFVLGGARETRGPAATAARTSLRVGLLGGALLGPAAAIGLGGRLPGLIVGVRDALVLALYVGILFSVAVTAASFVLALVLRRAPRIAGWLFTAGCLLYLTLWWQNANAGFGWGAPVWTAFALVVAVAISLLLGHAVRTAALAVLAAGGRGESLSPSAATTWRMIIGGGALAFLGAAALLIATASSEARGEPPAPLTVVDSRPVILIAIDGFDPGTFAQLEPSLPHLHGAFGARRFPLLPQDTSDPARAWTTIATGVPPDAHGVHAIETRRVAGLRGVIARNGPVGRVIGAASDLIRLTQPSIVTREQRQAKTMWEVAEEAGLRTAVINWWATWPAPPAPNGGIMITDRAVLRLENGGALDGEIAPASVYQALSAQWPAIRARARDAAAAAFPDDHDPQSAAILRRSGELDASIAAIAMAMERSGTAGKAPLDLFTVYFPGLDIAQDALLGSSAGALSTSATAAHVDALRSYYRFLDDVLAPLVQWVEDHRVMIVTQPGRVQTATGGLFAVAYSSGDGHAKNASWSPLDVAPTILATLGLPLSDELAGRPIATDPPSTSRHVATYGRPSMAAAPRTGRPLDQETIDRLRSLGYIK